jgi:hypothetical protein
MLPRAAVTCFACASPHQTLSSQPRRRSVFDFYRKERNLTTEVALICRHARFSPLVFTEPGIKPAAAQQSAIGEERLRGVRRAQKRLYVYWVESD